MMRVHLGAAFAAITISVSGGSVTVASAYQLKETNGGQPLRWDEGEVVFAIAMRDVPDGVLPVRVERAVGLAIDTWAEELPEGVAISGQATRGTPDGGNVITWVHHGWDDEFDVTALAMTLTTYDPESGQIRDADIFVNAEQFAWETDQEPDEEGDCAGRYDVENVVTHELGHALGMAHEEAIEEATMYPSAASCEVKKRDLDTDDEAGLSYLYTEVGPLGPEGGPMPLGCSVGGTQGSRRASGAAALGLALLAYLFLSRRPSPALYLAVLFASFVAFSLPAPAVAGSLRPARLGEIAARSVAIVRGVVVDRRVVALDGRLYTDHLVAVTEAWKGAPGEAVTVRVLGGEKDGVGMVAEGAPILGPGELVLFLRPRRDGALSVTGLEQGAFEISGSTLHRRVGGIWEHFSLDKVRALVVSAPGAPN